MLDEATWQTLQQLAQSGLVSLNPRATRHLAGSPAPGPPPLSPEQRQRIADLRTFAAKKGKVAALLRAEGMEDEAQPLAAAAAKALGEANRLEQGTT